jgi:hypothetical protein
VLFFRVVVWSPGDRGVRDLDSKGAACLAANSSRGRGPLADQVLASHIGVKDQMNGIELHAAGWP